MVGIESNKRTGGEDASPVQDTSPIKTATDDHRIRIVAQASKA
jgi:hypothetical protein